MALTETLLSRHVADPGILKRGGGGRGSGNFPKKGGGGEVLPPTQGNLY